MNDKLTPTTDVPMQVEVGINEPIPSDAEVKEAFREMGLIEVSAERLKKLRQVGVFTRGAGTIHLQRGRAMVTQEVLQTTLMTLHDEMESLKKDKNRKGRMNQMLKVSREIGHIGSKLTENIEVVRSMEEEVGVSGKDRAEAPTNKFVPNQPIQPVQINIQAEKATVNELAPAD